MNLPMRTSATCLLLALMLGGAACQSESSQPTEQPAPFQVSVVAEHLDQPWGLAFLPTGGMLVTQKTGQLIYLHQDQRSTVAGVPEVAVYGQGGLLDVALHPQFSSGQNWVYLSYSSGDKTYATTLGRGRFRRQADGSASLVDWQELFRLPQASGRGQHFGSRIAFDSQGYLYLSIGDRGQRERAQDLTDPAGSILRLHADGQIPDDNPFAGQTDVHPAIFTSGHRNPQGLARQPGSGQIWDLEHGPQGGDEVNRLQAGHNYGWPVITYGDEYGTGFSIGEGTHKDGMEQPLHYWKPSIAPSGMAFYQGDAFASWQGDLLVGALKYQRLVRLEIEDGQIVREHRYIPGEKARVRDVRIGPDGLIYLLTDARNGKLLRLSPQSD